MKKYVLLLLFYLIAIIVVFSLSRLSPNAPDGGLGMGSMALIFFLILIIILAIINLVKGFQVHKSFFIIAAIHIIVLLIAYWKLFY